MSDEGQPTSGGGLGEMWRGFPGPVRWVVYGFAALMCIGFISMLSGGDDGEPTAGGVAPEFTQPEEGFTPPAEPEPVAEPVDTGRMSQGEWEEFRDSVMRTRGEFNDGTRRLAGECVAILSAGQIAEGLDCARDSMDGLDVDLTRVVLTAERLQDDVARTCRTSVDRVVRVGEGRMLEAVLVMQRSVDTGDVGVMELAAREFASARVKWDDATGDTLVLCAPE